MSESTSPRTTPDEPQVEYEILEATWPAAEIRRIGPWKLRRGDGGGKRVSAATLDGDLDDPEPAETAMRAWNQLPTFQVREGEVELDRALEERGLVCVDPTLILAAAVKDIPAESRLDGAIFCDSLLNCMREIWDAGGIGPGRLAVMDRVAGPKTWILGRFGDRPVGCAFVAIHHQRAMLHALEVSPAARRHRLGYGMTCAAGRWAKAQGADRLSLAVTSGNVAARGLYSALGFAQVASYHYRVADQRS